MRKLSLSLLAASIALIPSGALAQGGPHGPHGPPPGGGMRGGMHGGMRGPGMMMRHGGPMGGHHFQRRLQRGFIVPQFWWGPQFSINNWQMYGFADPGADGRWVRYYDDAYLIDREGRIRDSREGLDWDRYGEEWEMADGIPAYRGDRDDDDEEGDEHAERGGHGEHHRMHHGGPPMYGPGPGYGYGGGYGSTQVYGGGYGYGMYAYPIVIETVTTSGGTIMTEEVVEEYVSVRRHRPHRARCVCRAPRPRPAPPPRRPPPGERG
jgi:Nickel/cobalt transporter regulator